MKSIFKYLVCACACCGGALTSCNEKSLEWHEIPALVLPSAVTLDIPAEVAPYLYTQGEQTILPMVQGTSVTLGYKVEATNPDELDFKEITWVSDDPAVATVDQNGKITAVGAGTTIVRAKTVAPSIMQGYVTVKVVATAIPVETIFVDDSAIAHWVDVDDDEYSSIYVSESVQLTALLEPSTATFQTVKWSSSDPTVASVDPVTGVVTGVSPSRPSVDELKIVTITATALDATNPVTATYEMYIDQIVAPIGIKLENAPAMDAKFALNTKTFTLNFKTYPEMSTMSLVKWESSDETVATVANGVVSFLAPGKVNITATCEDTESEIPSAFAGYTHQATATFDIPAGWIYEHFTDPASNWWVAKTAGTTMIRKQDAGTGENYMEIVPFLSNANTRRGDNGANMQIYLSRAYPIICIRIDDVNDVYGYSRNFNIDTSGKVNGLDFRGNFGGSNNKWKTKYKCSDGSAILVYDLSTQNFATGGVMPEGAVGAFGTFQFKYADIRKPGNANYNDGETAMFRFFWIETFASETAMTTYLNQWSTSTGITYAQ